MNAVRCDRCGKRVSNEVSEELIIRAWVECPECIEGEINGRDSIDRD